MMDFGEIPIDAAHRTLVRDYILRQRSKA